MEQNIGQLKFDILSFEVTGNLKKKTGFQFQISDIENTKHT